MLLHAFLLLGCLADEPKIEPEHARNEVYKLVLSQGIEAGGQVVKLPAPRMLDGQDAGAQRAALREVAGSDRAADDLLRPSVTAPYIIKVRDVKAGGAIIRVVDLWFIVYADIAQIDPAQEACAIRQQGSRSGQHAVSNTSVKNRRPPRRQAQAAGAGARAQ